MPALNNVSISYATNTINFSLASGEQGTIVIDIPAVGNGESLAESNMRISRIVDGLIQANLRYVKSIPEITELP